MSTTALTEQQLEVKAEQQTEESFGARAKNLLDKVGAIQVTDNATYEIAVEMIKSIKDAIRIRTDYFEPLRVSAKTAYDSVLAKKKEAIEPLEKAEEGLRAKANTYLREEENKRKETQRKAEEEAKRQAEEERKRLLAEAEAAMDSGDMATAQESIERAEDVYTAPVVVPSAVAQTVKTGSATASQSRDVTVEVVDTKAFLQALLAKNYAPTMVEVKIGQLKTWVKLNALEEFPGLRIISGPSVRIR